MKKTARTAFMLMCLLMVFIIGCRQQTIYHAVEKGDLADVTRHLQSGADVNAKDKDGNTPLMMAASMGKLDVVKYLVDKDAAVNAKDKWGNTALAWAVCKGHLDVIKFLAVRGTDLNLNADEDGITLLMVAAGEGHLDVVKFLMARGADQNLNARTKKGATALTCAEKYPTVVEFLKQHGATE